MKKQLKVSVCKSNVRKEATYYARVCKTGKVSKEGLINLVKEKAPYIDISSFEVGLEVLMKTIVECVESGLDVELFGLGTVGLKCKGSLKVDEAISKNLEGTFNKRDEISSDEKLDSDIEGSYEKDLSVIAKENIEFAVQFNPSRIVKKHIKENVEPSFITLKMRKPIIKSIEKVYSGEGIPTVIKIKGDDIKLVGEGMSLYIKNGEKVIQIPKEGIIQNEPKTLLIVTNLALKEREEYSLHLSTQYAKMGMRETSIIRRCVKEFSFENEVELKARKAG